MVAAHIPHTRLMSFYPCPSSSFLAAGVAAMCPKHPISRAQRSRQMAALGASRPLRRLPAMASFLSRKPALSLNGRNRSSCPLRRRWPEPGDLSDQAGKQSLDGASNFLSKTGPANELDLTSHCHSPPVDRTERSRTPIAAFSIGKPRVRAG